MDPRIISCHPLAPKCTTLAGSNFKSITLILKKIELDLDSEHHTLLCHWYGTWSTIVIAPTPQRESWHTPWLFQELQAFKWTMSNEGPTSSSKDESDEDNEHVILAILVFTITSLTLNSGELATYQQAVTGPEYHLYIPSIKEEL